MEINDGADQMESDEIAKLVNNDMELAQVKKMRKEQRKRRTWSISKLTKFYGELARLQSAGGTYADLQIWLSQNRRVKVERSTILRFLKKMKCKVG